MVPYSGPQITRFHQEKQPEGLRASLHPDVELQTVPAPGRQAFWASPQCQSPVRVLLRQRCGAGCSQHWGTWEVYLMDIPGEGQGWGMGRGAKERAFLGREVWINSISLTGPASAGSLTNV